MPTEDVYKAPTQFTTTPQFTMKHSSEMTPVLCGIEEWEIPFFNVRVLRSWLKHCDDHHGKQCIDDMSGNALLPTGFRVIDTQDMKILEHVDFVRWTWAFWLNPVRFDLNRDDYDLYFLKIASIVYFHYQDPDRGLRRLDITEMWIQDEISIEDLSRREELPSLDMEDQQRDWRDCPQNPWQTFERQALDPDACKMAAMFPGSLVFNTTAASLAIDHLNHAGGVPTKYEVFDASLLNKSGEAVGILDTVDFSWVEAHRNVEGNKKLFDCIVISGELERYSIRKNYTFFSRWDPSKWAEFWLLDVMLVQRLPCKPFVARRVAVGKVKLYKWKECDARWETVVLC
ncbi:hypothetical protein F4781DRAFT_437688 [Annulohypoxylon bovei var. microspora]|nr:hypothetical protein F4781DRAFT_437688 [Annulohypoxylon bovei var. microspora]